MRHCFQCEFDKPDIAFPTSRGVPVSPCKSCRSTYQKRWYERKTGASRQVRLALKARKSEDALLLKLRKRVIRLLRSLILREKYVTGAYWVEYRKVYRKKRPEKRKAERKRYKKAHPEKKNRGPKKRVRGRIPAWANRRAMVMIYRKRKEWSAILGIELHVDHVVPLRHPRVSGLHCEANLQLLADELNVEKSNARWPDDGVDLT